MALYLHQLSTATHLYILTWDHSVSVYPSILFHILLDFGHICQEQPQQTSEDCSFQELFVCHHRFPNRMCKFEFLLLIMPVFQLMRIFHPHEWRKTLSNNFYQILMKISPSIKNSRFTTPKNSHLWLKFYPGCTYTRPFYRAQGPYKQGTTWWDQANIFSEIDDFWVKLNGFWKFQKISLKN